VQARNLRVLARKGKAAGAVKCTECGVVQHAGRWYWGAPPLAELRAGICPACQRKRERYPAGTLQLHPGFLAHKKEVLQLIRNVERAEKAEHPLERLMEVEETDGHLVVSTTGIHIARQIAHRLARRFHQKARIRYAKQEDLIHVEWE
jgi:NMD protein affecting ribosome stability and mRNA decay